MMKIKKLDKYVFYIYYYIIVTKNYWKYYVRKYSLETEI